jgi:hypothetical protein
MCFGQSHEQIPIIYSRHEAHCKRRVLREGRPRRDFWRKLPAIDTGIYDGQFPRATLAEMEVAHCSRANPKPDAAQANRMTGVEKKSAASPAVLAA